MKHGASTGAFGARVAVVVGLVAVIAGLATAALRAAGAPDFLYYSLAIFACSTAVRLILTPAVGRSRQRGNDPEALKDADFEEIKEILLRRHSVTTGASLGGEERGAWWPLAEAMERMRAANQPAARKALYFLMTIERRHLDESHEREFEEAARELRQYIDSLLAERREPRA